jgi:hypothetical protein
MGAAFRTAEGKDLLLYPKVDSPIMIFAVNMLVSLNAEAMIKYTGGHARILLLIDFGRSSLGDRMSTLLSKSTLIPDEPFL